MVEPHMCTAELGAYDQRNIHDCAIQSNGGADETCPSKDFCASIPPSIPEVDAKQCCEWDWQ